ncbi:MAG: hypothetical protein GC136_10090 [Alphaproteobacteria bacterium]|nr:hypothetical protein [Alphaproteobacteria bacterium]
MRFTEHDETRVKNMYATYEEIDDRQSLEMLVLLNKWEKGQITAGDVITDIEHMFDLNGMLAWDYNWARKHGPGTSAFEQELALIKPSILEKKEKLGERCYHIADGQMEWVQRLYDPKGPVTEETRKRLLEEQKHELKGLQHQAVRYGDTIKIPQADALITGPAPYVRVMNDLVKARDEAVKESRDLGVVALEVAMLKVMLYRRHCEYDVEHIEESYEREKQEHIDKYRHQRETLTQHMRDDLASEDIRSPFVIENIQKLISRLENAETNSWEAAIETARFIFDLPEEKPKEKEVKIKDIFDDHSDETFDEEDDVPASRPRNTGKDTYKLKEFIRGLENARQEASELKKDINETLEQFSPHTEDSIKQPLARVWAEERASAEWTALKKAEKEAEKQKKKDAGLATEEDEWESDYISMWGFEEFFAEKHPEGQKVDFIPPIEFPDRKLCSEIHIAPSGTGLIQIYGSDPCHDGIYGTPVARITTYSVSFVPKNPEDKELLKDLVKQAMTVLGDTPYAFELPGWTPSGESYRRPPGKSEWGRSYEYNSESYIETADGRVSPRARFDLDDLWLLYYILEPVIEPSAQIANAMNMALYSEERGAILQPDSFDYVHAGHNVGDDAHYMKNVNPEDLLPKLLKDAFIDLALNNTDEAGFMIRLTTLADHTLTGKIVDAFGTLKTYNNLIDDQRVRGTAVSTYQEALTDRTKDLLAAFLQLPSAENADLGAALKQAVHHLAPSLKAHFRSKTRMETLQLYDALEKHMAEQLATLDNRWTAMMEHAATADERLEKITKLSDIFAGRGKMTDEDRKKLKENALAHPGNLVVADSAVETCMDGIHAGGRYRSKTKGSPYVRKEMPATLKPFVSNPDNRPSGQAVLQAPLNIIK